jgi:hypothetical protein
VSVKHAKSQWNMHGELPFVAYADVFFSQEANPVTSRLGNSGLKVSKIILGCMSYGSSKWEGSPWILDEEESLEIIKTAYDHGINTWV